MGWHLDLAVARVDGAAVPDWSSVREDPEQARSLVAALWPDRPASGAEPAVLEDALGWAADGVCVGAYGGTVLLSHAFFAPGVPEDVFAAMSRVVAGTVVHGVIEDAVVAYGLQAYRDGQLVRDYQWFDGAVQVDTGAPLPGEVDGDDEERVFAALGAVLGLRVDQGSEQGSDVEPLELPVHRFTLPAPPRLASRILPPPTGAQRLRGWLAGHPTAAALLVLLLVALLVQVAIRL